MPFIRRDENGKILALYREATAQAEEYLPDEDQEVIAFIALHSQYHPSDTHKALAKTDKEVARIAEDLITLMIKKNLITFTELPDIVQKKLLEREKLRKKLDTQTNDFLDDSESI